MKEAGALAQLTDDCLAFGGPFLDIETARDRLERRVRPVTETVSVPLVQADGRILACDVTAALDVPPHANSAVDGYAIFFDDLTPDRESVLPVRDRIAAGHSLGRAGVRGEAVRIFTGAPMPAGFDTVLMQEDCRPTTDGRVVIPAGIKRGANRRAAGEDITAGSVVLRAGRVLRPQDLGLLASIGWNTVPVRTPLRVALFSTGNEVCEPGRPLPPGCIYDANRYTLAALLRRLGAEVTDLGILADRFESVHDALAAAAPTHDLLLTSGGMSTGDEDHVKAAVEQLGVLHVWRLAIKPGRPVALGLVADTPFVGLPGNPVAVMVTFLHLARPLILRLSGAVVPEPRRFPVTADFAYKKKPGRREYVRTMLAETEDGCLVARKFPREGAGILSSMVESDGLVELSESMTAVAPGDLVRFVPFSELLG